MRTLNQILATAVLTVLLTGCSFNQLEEVKSVIYLIGDGMGMGAVSTAILTHEMETGFEKAPVIGLQETCSANNYVTDSPAGGTALATGTRTKNGYLGVDPDGNQLESILKKAQKMGKKSGIVVNTVLTEATPASFYAGVKSRKESYKIAEQFCESGVDVAIGSGMSAFVGRPDSVDLTKVLEEKGYDVYKEWKYVLGTQSEKFVAILPMEDVHRRNAPLIVRDAQSGEEITRATRNATEGKIYANDTIHISEPREYLTKACKIALNSLEKNAPDGFFLMIESAIIDGYGHNNDSEGMKDEMYEFNNTLLVLIDYVNQHPGTLLVVTADHETGGTGITYEEFPVGEKGSVHLNFSTKGHTGTLVPVFAYGAGAEQFGGVMKNKDIPRKIESLLKD